jgi:aspartate aminotransferase
MTKRIASRFDDVQESATFKIGDLVKRLRAEGASIADLGGGDPDFATPMHIVESGAKSMREGFTHYVASRGIPPLLEAISRDLSARSGLDYDPKQQIIVTPSAKHAIYIAMLTIVDPGDDVLILSPTWVSHEMIVRLVGGNPVFVVIGDSRGEPVTEELLERHVTPRSKALLLNSPNNPTGRVLTEHELSAVGAVAERHDLLIVSDEIYNQVVYDGLKAPSVGALANGRNRTLTVNGFSKTYAMTGWRLGYLAGPVDIIAEAVKAQQHTVGCAASFSQVAAVTALESSQDVVKEMVDKYDERRRFIVPALDELPGVTCATPAGAFYAWANIEGTAIPDSVEFASWLLREARVAVTPGSAFGPGGEGHIRLSFANSLTVIEEALGRMRAVLQARTAITS